LPLRFIRSKPLRYENRPSATLGRECFSAQGKVAPSCRAQKPVVTRAGKPSSWSPAGILEYIESPAAASKGNDGPRETQPRIVWHGIGSGAGCLNRAYDLFVVPSPKRCCAACSPARVSGCTSVSRYVNGPALHAFLKGPFDKGSDLSCSSHEFFGFTHQRGNGIVLGND
jgi:hypothetical protein